MICRALSFFGIPVFSAMSEKMQIFARKEAINAQAKQATAFFAKAFLAIAIFSNALESFAQSNQDLQRRCATGIAQSCYDLAIQYDHQHKEPGRAAEFAAKACDKNLFAACTFLGIKYSAGEGVSKDSFHAVRLFEKSCNGSGNHVGCQLFALALSEGDGIRQDKNKAYQYLATLCSIGHLDSCGSLARFYQEGWVIQRDHSKAAELLERACLQENFGARYCHELGLLYESGVGVSMDKKTALELYGKSCDKRSAKGCQNYARLKKTIVR